MGLASVAHNGVQIPLKLDHIRRLSHSAHALHHPISSLCSVYHHRPPHPVPLLISRRIGQDNYASEVKRINAQPKDDIGNIDKSPTQESLANEDYNSSIRNVALWVCGAVAFGVGLGFKEGFDKASEFFAGYILEQSLSVDNLFVFVLIFNYFKVPVTYQNRVLSYGIAGAVIFRLTLILIGTATLQRFEAVNLLLAAILLYSSFKLFSSEEDEADLADNFVVKTCQKFIPVTTYYDGDRFITHLGGVWKATPLLLTVAVIELSDIAFAVDSIPAVFGVTRDPFIVFTSNLFAILGLRSLYLIISEGMSELKYLQDLATGKTILTAKEQSGLYLLETNDQSTTNILSLQATSETWAKSQIWLHHKRLGHPSFNLIKSLFPHLFTNDSVESFNCDICQLSKHHRASYPISNKKSTSPFDLIHTDVWGPIVASISGAKWFVIFIDDCTRVTSTYLMNNKSEVFQIFVKFFHLVQNQFEKNIKRIRSDNGTEYVNHEFLNFFSHNGIVHELTCVNTPQQNGIAERKNRHLLEVTRALLFQMSVPKSYWGEAVLTATYLINRLPTRILNDISPIESLLSFVPSSPLISSLPSRIFGCIAFVHSHHPNRSKLDPKALKCIFIGYPSNKKGYKCYHPQSRRIFISMDVTFHETQSFYVSSPLQGEKTLEVDELSFLSLPCQSSQDAQDLSNETIRIHNKDEEEDRFFGQKYERRKQPTSTLEQEKLSNPEVRIPEDNIEEVSITDDLPIALRKERRSCAKYPISQHVCTNNLSDKHRSFIAAIDTTKIPTSIQEAMKLEHWTQAMKEEMNALERNSTWEIVDKPKDKKAVGCRWIFTVKHKADGTIERYKARLVAKGYTQTYGIDYEETFAPVAKMNTVRVILALAAHFRWDLHQLDVKNAFLHGDLEEEVYMDIPPGFEVKNEQNKVCLLKKALYGLKQSPRAWFGRFTKAMISLGYRQSQGDRTLFIKHSSTGKLTLLLVYVDDMIIAGDDEAEKLALKEKLASQFEMKDLGKLKYFLGIEVVYSKEGIFISQRKYVLDLLKETGKLGCRTSTIPIEQNHRIGSEESAPVEKTQYQRLVGKLIYLSHTRPDIAYAVSVVSQFMHDPRNRHMQAVDKILQYLKSSPGKGLLFKREDTLSMKIYTDADYAGSITDRKSTSGYCMFLGNSLVTWRSKKQDRVSRSSAEAEFRALAQGMCEGLWMKIIFDDLKIKMDSPVQLYCDNKSAISIAHNPVQHDRTKHIEIDRHFIKDNLDRGFMIATHVPTGLQLADIFTKGLPQGRFQDLVNKLGMIDIHLPT